MFTIIGGDGKEYGPATADQLRGWIAAGRANLDTKAKAVGSEEWRRLGDYPEFGEQPSDIPPVVGAAPDVELADRLYRLGAWFLDNILAFLCCLPGFLVVGSSVIISLLTGHGDITDAMSGRLVLGWLVIAAGGVALLVVQIWMLTTRGQTVGKRMIGVRIVRAADGTNPGFVSAVVMRAIVPGLIATVLNIIPGLGLVFTIVDVCFIFRADRRCIHDFIAGTKVVKA